MVNNICFFTGGFAFNRLVRMKYYEKIFPEKTKIFLFTTDKYSGKEKEAYQYQWTLDRTKIHSGSYSWRIIPELRRFCKENNIERIANLGVFRSSFILLSATVFSKTKVITNVMDEITSSKKSFMTNFLKLLQLYIIVLLSKKTIFNDRLDFEKTRRKLGWIKKDLIFLPAPTDIEIFKRKDRKSVRRKLGIPLNKKVIVFVGRINYGKGSDLLWELVKRNGDILFIAVGRIMDDRYRDHNEKNLWVFEKKSSKELAEIYSAADLGMFVQRIEGGGLGMTTQEAMACGVPSMNRDRDGIGDDEALFKIKVDKEEVNKFVRKFFKMDKRERQKLSDSAKKFIEENFSGEVLKHKNIGAYLS